MHWSFGAWAATGFALMLGCLALLVYEAISRIHHIGESLNRVVSLALPAQERAHAMQAAAQNRVALMLRMLAEPDPFDREVDAEAFRQEGLAFGQARDALTAMALDEPVRRQLDLIRGSAVALSRTQREVVQALIGGDDPEARVLIHSQGVFEKQRVLLEQLEALATHQRAVAQEAQQSTQEQQARARTVVLALGGGLIALGLCLGSLVSRAIVRSERLLRDEGRRADVAAHTDPLTGLLNRRGFERDRRLWRDGPLAEESHSLLLIDLDRFKAVNDAAGHEAGDALLQRLAQLLRDQTRPQDLVARLGGDEFGLLLQGLPATQAGDIAERIRQAVGGFAFDWLGQLFTVGASIGVIEVKAKLSDADWSEHMKRADEACYAAKHGGRNQVVLWSPMAA